MSHSRHLGISAACTSLTFLVQLASLAGGMPEQIQPLAPNRLSRVVVSWSERVPMTPELEESLAAEMTARDRARAVVWYDALATLYQARQDTPDNPDLQADWNALLNDVGLAEAAQKCGDCGRRAEKRSLFSSLLPGRKFSRASPLGVHRPIAETVGIHGKPLRKARDNL